MTNQANITTVAVLGTGIIGAPVARNLCKQGFAVRAWNRTSAKAKVLEEVEIHVAMTPQDAVTGAKIIVTLLKDGPSVLQAMQGVANDLPRGAIWAQMSTVGPEATEQLAAFAEQHGLVFYDAPVQGTRQPAEQGQLIILASGPAMYREAVQPLFNAIGKRTVWVSEQAGAGSRLKLALNSWVFALTHGVAESLAIAQGLGVDPALVIDIVKGGPLDSGYFQLKAAAILAGDYTTSFSVANAMKDSQLVVETAQKAGLTVDIATASLQRFRRAFDTGHGDKDIAASFLA